MNASMRQRQPLAWVPWTFVGAFALIIAVNAVLIVFATRTFSGLVVEKPYQKGLAYEATLRQEEAQATLGWQTTTSFRAQANGGGEIGVRYLDASGRPATGLAVTVALESPLRPEPALEIRLAYQGEGWYRAAVEVVRGGQREAVVTAAAGAARHVMRFRFVMQ